jgi:predicted SnoaL-like aldol condensation-catalyzing enzyme
LAGLVDYVKSTRPEREIKPALDLPLVNLLAEGNYVTTTFVRPEKDANGETYYSSWFDLYRIENGKIVEHWDPALKSDPKIDPNDKKL